MKREKDCFKVPNGRKRFNRSFIKNKQKAVKHVSMSKSSYSDLYEEWWPNREKKLFNYLDRWLETHVGQDYNKVLEEFSHLDWKNGQDYYPYWKVLVERSYSKYGRDDENLLYKRKKIKKDYSSPLTDEEKVWNDKAEVPDYGIIMKRSQEYWTLVPIRGCNGLLYLNKFYIAFGDKSVSLPVYAQIMFQKEEYVKIENIEYKLYDKRSVPVRLEGKSGYFRIIQSHKINGKEYGIGTVYPVARLEDIENVGLKIEKS